MIKIKGLGKKYKNDSSFFYALKDINLSFPNTQFVSILGPSGCGKSTLLNCIGTLDGFEEGDIFFNGSSLKNMKEADKDAFRNSQIGFVFQSYYLVPKLNVIDNVKLALSVRNTPCSEIENKAMGALKCVGMAEFAKKKPSQLSGGQAQRVAIARSIVTNPSVLLADEPTGSLDSESSKQIMELLKELSKDRLVLMVTHNEDLAKKYSDRIVNLKDGHLESDQELAHSDLAYEEKPAVLNRCRLRQNMVWKLSLKNIFSRKAKTILTAVANSFGMISVGFVLAINLGFSSYSSSLSAASATSLPVVVTAYNKVSDSESYSSKNASVLYPSTEEIYPSVDTTTSYAYTYNNFSQKYMSYLETLKLEGVLREYVKSYGNDYSFNLTTNFPDSINGENKGGINEVSTTLTSYNYYGSRASLPYNIFHVLYGDLDQYDVIAGSLPKTQNDVVLVVDKYNAVSFKILQALGFYNSNDTQKDVSDTSLSTKVKPISFSSILGKEYTIYSNDDYYTVADTIQITDAMGSSRIITRYEQAKLTADFFKNKGTHLSICGIIRPKSTSPFTILSPALCYSQELQNTWMSNNEEGALASSLPNNLYFSKPDDLSDSDDAVNSFAKEVQEVLDSYSSASSSVLPTSQLNSIFSRYFCYVPYVKKNYVYIGVNTYLKDCRTHGASLVDDSLLGQDISSIETMESWIDTLLKDYASKNYDALYKDVISLIAYANAYSNISCIVLFPYDLAGRTSLLKRLDDFNKIQEGSSTHAQDESEVVSYASENANQLLEEVGQMISLASIILVVFAIISLIVSCAMTASLTSNNVLERKKEIGLLRSLGSKKGDIITLFETESLIIGLLGGVLGALLTYLLSFPFNALINSYYGAYSINNICAFTWYHALIIVALGLGLSLLSCFIPALQASKKHPVECLKEE